MISILLFHSPVSPLSPMHDAPFLHISILGLGVNWAGRLHSRFSISILHSETSGTHTLPPWAARLHSRFSISILHSEIWAHTHASPLGQPASTLDSPFRVSILRSGHTHSLPPWAARLHSRFSISSHHSDSTERCQTIINYNNYCSSTELLIQ